MMDKWTQLTEHQQGALVAKYGITCHGQLVPASEEELLKVPQSEWDRLFPAPVVEEKPKRKRKAKK